MTDAEESSLLRSANRKLLGWVGSGVVAIVAATSGAAVYATNLNSKVDRLVIAAERLAFEMERRPTAAEINLMWRTASALNPDLKLGPLLDAD
ncbi:MAG: hypothetical protein WBM40_12785 [Thiohalocapsa sp.]